VFNPHKIPQLPQKKSTNHKIINHQLAEDDASLLKITQEVNKKNISDRKIRKTNYEIRRRKKILLGQKI
jgi:hypothetical protein